jgi:hypothetical protein
VSLIILNENRRRQGSVLIFDQGFSISLVVQFGKEVSQTRDDRVAKNATLHGSPGSFAAQKTLAQDDKQSASVQHFFALLAILGVLRG